jgi:hypothetical protein
MGVLVVGALAGTALGMRHRAPIEPAEAAPLSAATPTPSTTAVHDVAETVARAKAMAAAAAAAEKAQHANEVARRESASPSDVRSTYPVPTSCNDYTANRALGCALLLDAGYGLEQMPCLEKMWTKESGWNPKSTNASSGAYGIPQALPGDKMAIYGSDWRTNPVPQIRWGLSYIKSRYGDPCGAWSFWLAHNWY